MRAPRTERPPEPPNAERRLRGRDRSVAAAILAAALFVGGALVVLGPAAGSVAAAPAAPTVAGSATGAPGVGNTTWAWGAMANLSFSAQFAGAFNASVVGPTGNLTSSGAAVALDESLAARYAAYAVVNATTPAPGQLRLELAAAEYRALAISVVGSGMFPVAGTYNASTVPPLAPMNLSLAAEVEVLNAATAFLNFTTGPNGSLALADEHVEALRAINLSLAAVNFPNVTQDAQGNTVLRYTTGSIGAAGFVAENVSASFAPALPVVEGPLAVGKNWSAATNATFTGAFAYGVRYAVSSPGNGTFRWSQAGTVSANATLPVALTFTVVGSRTLYYPNGASETDYVIVANGTHGNSSVYLVDGLLVLPVADPTHAAGIPGNVGAAPAAAPTTTAGQPASRAVYSDRSHLPVSVEASPVSGQSVTASPVAPSSARAAIAGLRAGTPPAPAVGPVAPNLGGLEVALGVAYVGIVAFALRREARLRRGRA